MKNKFLLFSNYNRYETWIPFRNQTHEKKKKPDEKSSGFISVSGETWFAFSSKTSEIEYPVGGTVAWGLPIRLTPSLFAFSLANSEGPLKNELTKHFF